jgi:hypothetical protein
MEDYPQTVLELEDRFSTEDACREYLAPISAEPNRLTLSGGKSMNFRGVWGGSVSRFLRCFAIKARWVAYVGRLEIVDSSMFSRLLTEIRLPALDGPRYDWASGVPIID